MGARSTRCTVSNAVSARTRPRGRAIRSHFAASARGCGTRRGLQRPSPAMDRVAPYACGDPVAGVRVSSGADRARRGRCEVPPTRTQIRRRHLQGLWADGGRRGGGAGATPRPARAECHGQASVRGTAQLAKPRHRARARTQPSTTRRRLRRPRSSREAATASRLAACSARRPQRRAPPWPAAQASRHRCLRALTSQSDARPNPPQP